MSFAAWTTASQLSGWLADAGTAALLLMALLAAAYAALAAYATWQTWRARPLGRMLGLAVAVIRGPVSRNGAADGQRQ